MIPWRLAARLRFYYERPDANRHYRHYQCYGPHSRYWRRFRERIERQRQAIHEAHGE